MDEPSNEPEQPGNRLPYGWTNGVWHVGDEAIKHYLGADSAANFEASLLKALHSTLPVPAVISFSDRELRMEFVPGINGQPALEGASESEARSMFAMLGRLLARTHELGAALDVDLPGEGESLVHGDFSWPNTIFSEDRRELRAVVDWEKAHLGDIVEDIAWFEWNVRKWWPPRLYGMSDFFDAYGTRPDWATRHQAMLSCIDRHISRITPVAPHLVPKWQGFREEVERYEPLDKD